MFKDWGGLIAAPVFMKTEEFAQKNEERIFKTRYDTGKVQKRIFSTVPYGKTKLNVWPRDKNGNLID